MSRTPQRDCMARRAKQANAGIPTMTVKNWTKSHVDSVMTGYSFDWLSFTCDTTRGEGQRNWWRGDDFYRGWLKAWQLSHKRLVGLVIYCPVANNSEWLTKDCCVTHQGWLLVERSTSIGITWPVNDSSPATASNGQRIIGIAKSWVRKAVAWDSGKAWKPS